MNETKPKFPMRINKYVALKNKINRREADALIKDQKIFINGRPAVLGDKVQETDTVDYRFRGKHHVS
jgi:16S rRNA U516 pseudouridylate synthase RsuA-like enzyme